MRSNPLIAYLIILLERHNKILGRLHPGQKINVSDLKYSEVL